VKPLVATVFVWGGLFLLFWIIGPSTKIRGPSTGESCVVFVERLFAQRKTHRITDEEERDLDLCTDK
jgi:hypothetical protein